MKELVHVSKEQYESMLSIVGNKNRFAQFLAMQTDVIFDIGATLNLGRDAIIPDGFSVRVERFGTNTKNMLRNVDIEASMGNVYLNGCKHVAASKFTAAYTVDLQTVNTIEDGLTCTAMNITLQNLKSASGKITLVAENGLSMGYVSNDMILKAKHFYYYSDAMPDGFDLKRFEHVYLYNIKKVPSGLELGGMGTFNATNAVEVGDGFNPDLKGMLTLSNVRKVGSGFSPNVKYHIDLSTLTEVPDDFAPHAGGILYLRSLPELPANFKGSAGKYVVLKGGKKVLARDDRTGGEMGEQEGGSSYPSVTKWETGMVRGVANNIDQNSKWTDLNKIVRGKANTLL